MTTDRERWQRVSRLFDRAIELEGDARAAFVAAECSGDAALRDELQRMLDADVATSGFDAGVAGAVSLDEPSEPEDASGDRLGAWRLLSRVGSGGMGTVYAAQREDGDTAQRAAIKRLQRRWDGSAQAQRFLQERRILAQLSHANIPALLDHGLDDEGRPWFALEFVDGKPLAAWADAQRLNPRERIVLMLQVCAAVQHAHERFVVHRDLKPANILVDAGGRARVLDFGVAKRIDDAAGNTVTGLFAGFTPEYAAPEQIAGRPVSAATDVHALGVMLYELLSGQLPYRFEQADLRSAAEAITDRSAERLDRALITGTPDEVQARIDQRRTSAPAFRRYVRGDLTRIVQTALAKEPERRYSSVQALSDDLKRFLDGRPVSVSGDTFGYRARKFVQRNRGAVTMATITVLAVMAGVIGMAWQTREAQQQARRAEAAAKRAELVKEFTLQILADTNPSNAGFGGDALRVLQHNSNELLKRFINQPELLAELASVMASARADFGDDANAEKFLRETLARLQAQPETPISAIARIKVRLANSTLDRGEPAETEALIDQAIEELREDRKGDADALADAWQIRAYLRSSQGRGKEAIQAAQIASAIANRQLGADSRATRHAELSVLIILATADTGQNAEAALREGEQIAKRIRDHFGDRHPVTLTATKYLAMLEQQHGRLDRAEVSYKRLLAAVPEGRAVGIHQELGSLYEDGDRFAEALAEYTRALALSEAAQETTPHSLSAVRNNMAVAYHRQGNWNEAERYFRRAADDWQRIHGSADHPYVLSARTRQADALVESGKLQDANSVLADLLPRLQAHDKDFYPIALGVRAKSALARLDLAAARTAIAEAQANAPKGELSARSLAALDRIEAQVRAADRDLPGATVAADRAVERLQDADPWRNPEMARALAVRLQVADAAGKAMTACEKARTASSQQPTDKDQPFQRELRRVLHRCGS